MLRVPSATLRTAYILRVPPRSHRAASVWRWYGRRRAPCSSPAGDEIKVAVRSISLPVVPKGRVITLLQPPDHVLVRIPCLFRSFGRLIYFHPDAANRCVCTTRGREYHTILYVHC